MPKIKKQKHTCVNCKKELGCYQISVFDPHTGIVSGKSQVGVCQNKKCKNYGLLAVSLEQMPKD